MICCTELAPNFMMLTRRKFAIGCGAFASSAILDAPLGFTDPAPEDTHLPIPTLIDAAKQGNAVYLKSHVRSARFH